MFLNLRGIGFSKKFLSPNPEAQTFFCLGFRVWGRSPLQSPAYIFTTAPVYIREKARNHP